MVVPALEVKDNFERADPDVKFTQELDVAFDQGVIVMTPVNFNDIVNTYSPLLMHLYYSNR